VNFAVSIQLIKEKNSSKNIKALTQN